MSGERIKLGLALAALIGVAVWLALSFELVEERKYVGLQGEAARNPYLAAERLFERMGMAPLPMPGRFDADALPPDAVLILPRGRDALTPAAIDALLGWAGRGGHLIVEAEPLRRPDPLLARLGIDRVAAGPRSSAPAELPATGERRALKIAFASQPRLDSRRQRSARNWAGVLVQLPAGKGQVTVLNDFSFMRYKALGREDHAELLWRLARELPLSRRFAISSRPQTPSLWDWLRQNALAALASGGALLALCLWRVVPRFGPLAPDPEPGRRRLLDHLRASGRFHWSSGGAARLIGAAREACLRNVARVHPDIVALEGRERAERLAELSGLRSRRIERALDPGAQTAHEFTEAVRTLQLLQEKLVRSW